MSLYFLLFLLLAVGALAEWFLPHYEKQIYVVCLAAMTACVCLRYGQGVDYITYHALYETIPPVIDLSKGYICGFYPEIAVICFFWKITANNRSNLPAAAFSPVPFLNLSVSNLCLSYHP